MKQATKVKMLGSWWVAYWSDDEPFNVIHLKAQTREAALQEVIDRKL